MKLARRLIGPGRSLFRNTTFFATQIVRFPPEGGKKNP